MRGLNNRHRLRRWILDIHAWMGAVAAIFILCVSVTGIALAFTGSIMSWETDALHVSGERAVPADLDDLIESAQIEAGDSFIPVGYLGPNAEIVTQAEMIYGLSAPPNQGGEVQIVSFDPATDQSTGLFYLDRTFTHQLIDFHYELLAGEFGLVLIAIVGLLMALLAVAGLYLWWPRKGRVFKKALNTEMKGPWRRKSLRLHSLSGFWLSLAVLIWGLSGAYWSKPDWFPEGLSPQTDRAYETLPESFTSAVCETLISPGEAVTEALLVFPNTRLFEAEFAAPWQNYHIIYLADEGDIDKHDADKRVWVQASCEGLIQSAEIGGLGNIGGAAQSVHSARAFGIFRIPIIILIGLSLILMSITGLHLWWVRVFKRPVLKTSD